MNATARRTWTGTTIALALAGGVGCTETRTYTVSLRNGLDRPVTVCLTKSFGPEEPDWESPEELAGPSHPASDERPPGVVLRPGQTAHQGPVEGEFYRDRGQAVLRVYAGTPTLSAMNATSRGSPDRLDIQLRPGTTDLDLQQQPSTGRMVAVPMQAADAPAARR